jgi:hypothetical protein
MTCHVPEWVAAMAGANARALLIISMWHMHNPTACDATYVIKGNAYEGVYSAHQNGGLFSAIAARGECSAHASGWPLHLGPAMLGPLRLGPALSSGICTIHPPLLHTILASASSQATSSLWASAMTT